MGTEINGWKLRSSDALVPHTLQLFCLNQAFIQVPVINIKPGLHSGPCDQYQTRPSFRSLWSVSNQAFLQVPVISIKPGLHSGPCDQYQTRPSFRSLWSVSNQAFIQVLVINIKPGLHSGPSDQYQTRPSFRSLWSISNQAFIQVPLISIKPGLHSGLCDQYQTKLIVISFPPIHSRAMDVMESNGFKTLLRDHTHLIAEVFKAFIASTQTPLIGPPRKRQKTS